MVLHESGREAGPVVGRGRCHDAIEVIGIALRLHHRLTAASAAANEIGVVRPLVVVVLDDGLGGFCGQMHRTVPKVPLPFGMIQRPGSLNAVALVPRVRTHRSVAALQRTTAVSVEATCLVLDTAHEAATPAHQEPSVPGIGLGQQQLELDLGLDHASDTAVRRDGIGRGHDLGFADAHGNQFERRQAGAPIHGGRRRTGRGNRQPDPQAQSQQRSTNRRHRSLLFQR